MKLTNFFQGKKSSSLDRSGSSSSSTKSTPYDAIEFLSQEIQPVDDRNGSDAAVYPGTSASPDVAVSCTNRDVLLREPQATDSVYKELKETFNVFDTNGDGRISKDELYEVLRSLDPENSEEDLQQMFEAADTDGNGYIEFEEFIQLNRIVDGPGSASRSEELREAFRVFDKDNNDYISAEELHQVLSRLGPGSSLTLEECSRMIAGVDSNRDGKVDFQEFERMMTANWVF